MQDIINWMAMIGIPSVFSLTVVCIRLITTFTKKIKVLMDAQQAQMRGQLLDNFYKYKDRKYIYQDELDEWINQYNAYHCLGANGVLDAVKNELVDFEKRRR